MQLASLADPSLVFTHVPGGDAISVLRSFAERIVKADVADAGTAEDLFQALWEREQLGSTGIGAGVAIPHCKIAGLERVLLAFGYSREPVDFGAVDGEPVQLFFVVASPASDPAAHLQCLATISKWIQQSGGIDRLLKISDPQELYAAMADGGD
ncbi:MAG: PTS sugar transporter subunit IIA [Acidobacteriota bacterium]